MPRQSNVLSMVLNSLFCGLALSATARRLLRSRKAQQVKLGERLSAFQVRHAAGLFPSNKNLEERTRMGRVALSRNSDAYGEKPLAILEQAPEISPAIKPFPGDGRLRVIGSLHGTPQLHH